jgi:hypothetical protein
MTIATIHSDDRNIADRAIASSRGRKRHHEIGETHDRAAERATNISGDQTEQSADGDGDSIRHHPDDERGAGAKQLTREEVATKKVGAEEIFVRRRQRTAVGGNAVREVIVGVVRCKLGCEQCRCDDRQQHDRAGEAKPMTFGQPQHPNLFRCRGHARPVCWTKPTCLSGPRQSRRWLFRVSPTR